MRAEGLEPSSSREHRLLKPACLPFHHARGRQCRGSSSEAVEAKELDVVARLAVEREVGEDLADDGAELVAVAGEAGADDGGRGVRVAIDEEVLVR